MRLRNLLSLSGCIACDHYNKSDDLHKRIIATNYSYITPYSQSPYIFIASFLYSNLFFTHKEKTVLAYIFYIINIFISSNLLVTFGLYISGFNLNNVYLVIYFIFTLIIPIIVIQLSNSSDIFQISIFILIYISGLFIRDILSLNTLFLCANAIYNLNELIQIYNEKDKFDDNFNYINGFIVTNLITNLIFIFFQSYYLICALVILKAILYKVIDKDSSWIIILFALTHIFLLYERFVGKLD